MLGILFLKMHHLSLSQSVKLVVALLTGMYSSLLQLGLELQYVSVTIIPDITTFHQSLLRLFLIIASGEADFQPRSVNLTFGPGVTQQEVMITIIDDIRLEPDEQFNSIVSLTVADPAVTLNPVEASIIIIDNNSEFELKLLKFVSIYM